MSLLEYEITKCWREEAATKIRLNSKPDVGAWIPGALAQKVGRCFSRQHRVPALQMAECGCTAMGFTPFHSRAQMSC